jgi:hypothetical protein
MFVAKGYLGQQYLQDVIGQVHHCFLHALPTTVYVGKAFKKPQ